MKHTKLLGKLAVGLVGSAILSTSALASIKLNAMEGWDVELSGNVNGYYTYSSCDEASTSVIGGLTCPGNFDENAVRNGLVPAAFVLSAKTKEGGYDVGVTFGVWPGINSSLFVNSGGYNYALGSPGIDFRQIFLTVGNDQIGTFKVGRDIVPFGATAILEDMTIYGVGGNASVAAPVNTALGRIGIGYLYMDWLPQISWESHDMNGFKLNLGIYQPLNAATSLNSDLDVISGTATLHNTPMAIGGFTWTYNRHEMEDKMVKNVPVAKVWGNVLFQEQKARSSSEVDWNGYVFELGAKASISQFEALVYGYHGRGVGTTGYFINAVSVFGTRRESEGGYVQGLVKFNHDKTRIGYSYGFSDLERTADDTAALTDNLVSRNKAHIVGIYHNLTKHVRLTAEYSHVDAADHVGNHSKEDTGVIGANLFF